MYKNIVFPLKKGGSRIDSLEELSQLFLVAAEYREHKTVINQKVKLIRAELSLIVLGKMFL